MKPESKTKAQLVEELSRLKTRVQELERKEVEEMLQESGARLKAQYQGGPIPTFTWRKKGKTFELVDFNQAAEGATGGKAKTFLGKTAAEMYQDRTEILEDIHRCFRGKKVIKRELTSRHFMPGRTMAVTYAFVPPDLIMVHAEDITERKRTEEAMRNSEETFRTLAENANDGIFIAVGEGIQTYANRRAGEISGYSVAELLKSGIRDLVHPDDVQKVMERYRKRLTGEPAPSQYEVNIIRKDRKTIPIELTAAKTVWHGSPADLVIIRDITERKRSQEALQESEEKYRNLVERSTDGIGIGQDGILRFANKRLTQMIGYSVEEMVGAPLSDFLMADQVSKVIDFYKRRMDGEDIPTNYETALRHKDGSRIEVEFNAGIITYRGRPADFVQIKDITERKHLEEALRESEEKFRKIFDNSSIGMSMTSLDGSVYVNQSLSEMLGYTREELSGLKWQDFTHPDDIELTQEHIEQMLSGEKTSVRFNKRYIKKDGSTLWGDLNTVLQKDKSGNPLYYISGLVDITERRRWEALIERTMRETRMRFEVSQALVGKETEDEVLDALIQQAGIYPQALVAILTFEKSDAGLVGILRRIDYFSSGLTKNVPLGTLFPSSEFSIINRYVTGLPFVSNNVLTDEGLDPSVRDLISRAGGRSFAAFLLEEGKELLGLIIATAGSAHYFDKGKEHLYKTLAEQGAVALRAAYLRGQIRESQKRFQDLVETLNDWIWEVNQDGVYTYVSPKIRDLLGFEPEELLGKTPFDLMPSEEAQRVSGIFEPLKAARQPLITLENTCRHKDGHLVVFETSGMPFFDGEEQFRGYRGIDRDISERKQIQNALQMSEERFRIAAESSNDFIYEWDLNTGQLEWFGAATERLNYLFSELPVTTAAFEKSIHPEDYERISQAVRRQVRYGEPYRQEYRLIGKTGDIFHIKTAGMCLRDENGRAYKWIGTTSDISEHKRAEEALHQTEEKYRGIVENSVEGIFQFSSDWKFLMANTAVARFHGYDTPEKLMTDISDIGEQLYVHPEDRQRYLNLMAEEGLVKGFEAQLYTKHGRIKWGSMNVRSVKDNRGKILYYEGTIEDITTRKEAEEGLQKSLEKLRKATGGIIQAMALTVETRDPYTAGHQRRVADLARSIAQEMGLPEDQVDGIRMAGIVHDLGKIAVPAEILSKPTQLSDIEFGLIKVHPQISYDILKDIDFSWPVADIVLQHHERINGSGYPLGLSGEAIYLEARILAVADVVEAIASHRPYRPAYGIDVALEEISKNKGQLYHTEVVDACLRLFREKGYKFD